MSQSKFVAASLGPAFGMAAGKYPEIDFGNGWRTAALTLAGQRCVPLRFQSVHASGDDARWRAAQSDTQLSAQEVTQDWLLRQLGKVEELNHRLGFVAVTARPQTWLAANAGL